MKSVISFIIFLLLIRCTDAERASLSAYGESSIIKCYSGGKIIYDGVSSGRVATTKESDGWEFKDMKSGKFIRVSGDCVVEN